MTTTKCDESHSSVLCELETEVLSSGEGGGRAYWRR